MKAEQICASIELNVTGKYLFVCYSTADNDRG